MSAQEAINLVAVLGLTALALAAMIGFLRERRPTQFDLAMSFATLAIGLNATEVPKDAYGSLIYRYGPFLVLLQPLLITRVLRHFVALPIWELWLARASVAGAVTLTFFPLLPSIPLPTESPAALRILVAGTTLAVLAAAAASLIALALAFHVLPFACVLLARTSRGGGIRGRRMRLAAVGYGMAIGAVVIYLVAAPLGSGLIGAAGRTLGNTLLAFALVALYLGFASPRWLVRLWQRSELLEFLRASAGVGGEARAEHLATEITRSVTRATGGLRTDLLLARGSELVSTSETPLPVAANAVAQRVWRTSQPEFSGGPSPLTGWSFEMKDATSALAAPIATGDQRFGVIVTTLRGGALFPVDDLELLSLLGEQAAIAFSTAALIREQRMLAEDLRASNDQLAAASRAKSEFLANMSHELRTPLNAVIGFSDVLVQRSFGELNSKQDEYLRDIRSSGAHLLSLVNDILDLSKVEAGRMELERSSFAISDAVLSTLSFVRERAARHGIELAHDVPDDIGTLVADERKVRQVLLNLLSNAVKFTPDGGWIGVRAGRSSREVTISVRDTGIGIAPPDQAKIFEEFGQTAIGARTEESTGLGLTLARRFIELHGGRLWVESELGKGSTFAFTLPVVDDITSGGVENAGVPEALPSAHASMAASQH